MTKEELLAKTQASIEKQEAKLKSLKEKRVDESQDAIDDVRAAIANLEEKLAHAKAKAKDIASYNKTICIADLSRQNLEQAKMCSLYLLFILLNSN